jgi:uncharacterized protein YcfJ
MRLNDLARRLVLGGAAGLGLAMAMPASAHDSPVAPPSVPVVPDSRPDWKGPMPPYAPQGYAPQAYVPPVVDPRAREDWLRECRRRTSSRDDGVGGALIGGAIGGLAGNRIAGHGHRTVGTVAGAAVGAVAGAAIDRAEDRGRERDWCETYLDDYYARYSQPAAYGYPGAAGQGYVQGYAVPMMMVPVQRTRACRCEEEVVEDRPAPHRRHIPRRAPDKRIRVIPDKRVPIR